MDSEQRINAKSETVNARTAIAIKHIWVRFQKEGIHAYPAAADDPNLEDVGFLANPHRHIFHFEVRIAVTHDDREIEFIQFKRFLEGIYDTGILELDNKSCEMIADDLFQKIAFEYPDREVIISVSEDNENGATAHYTSTIIN